MRMHHRRLVTQPDVTGGHAPSSVAEFLSYCMVFFTLTPFYLTLFNRLTLAQLNCGACSMHWLNITLTEATRRNETDRTTWKPLTEGFYVLPASVKDWNGRRGPR